MLTRYKKFLYEFDKRLEEYFYSQNKYIKCHKGCTYCCEVGEYPFSRLEAEYLMEGFHKLALNIQSEIKKNISSLLGHPVQKRFEYRCPFLIDNRCVLYSRRGITCRTFGLAYLDRNIVKLPECAKYGLNYSNVYNPVTNEINIQSPIAENLRIDSILRSPLAEKYELECGEIRPLIEWFRVNI